MDKIQYRQLQYEDLGWERISYTAMLIEQGILDNGEWTKEFIQSNITSSEDN